LLAKGGSIEWINGNVGADKLAGQGAALLAPPRRLLAKEKLRITTARTFHRMAVHMLAIYRGHLAACNADGHEALLVDASFGLGDAGDEEWALGIDDELMDEVMQAHCLEGAAHPEEDDVNPFGACDMDDPDKVWVAVADVHVENAQPTHADKHPQLPRAQAEPFTNPKYQHQHAQPLIDPPSTAMHDNTSARLAQARKQFARTCKFFPTKGDGDAGQALT
jgi:hypothetical protein